MLLTLEKVLILNSVDIFSGIPDEYLVELASTVEEMAIPTGTEIIAKGDIGSSMYVIISGKVRIHDDNEEIAVLSDRDVFGELAALDPEPRFASISAITETKLFRISERILYELISEHKEVAHAVIRHLCQRVRQTTPAAKTADAPSIFT